MEPVRKERTLLSLDDNYWHSKYVFVLNIIAEIDQKVIFIDNFLIERWRHNTKTASLFYHTHHWAIFEPHICYFVFNVIFYLLFHRLLDFQNDCYLLRGYTRCRYVHEFHTNNEIISWYLYLQACYDAQFESFSILSSNREKCAGRVVQG